MSNSLTEVAKNVTLITGGARSGKSDFAEKLALQSKRPVFYLATMEEVSSDAEAIERISRHRSRRPEAWTTLEVPTNLHESIASLPETSSTCIVDCISLYVSNLLLKHTFVDGEFFGVEHMVMSSIDQVLQAMIERPATDFLVVTNEVGWGIVPENGLARAYRDLLGFSNQKIARAASVVYLCCSGLQIIVKSGS